MRRAAQQSLFFQRQLVQRERLLVRSLNHAFIMLLSNFTCMNNHTVWGHQQEELAEQRVDQTRYSETPDEIKDFIQKLALKYGCEVETRELPCEMRNEPIEKVHLPGLWNECRASFLKVLRAIEDITQIVYKLNICMEKHKVIHLRLRPSKN